MPKRYSLWTFIDFPNFQISISFPIIICFLFHYEIASENTRDITTHPSKDMTVNQTSVTNDGFQENRRCFQRISVGNQLSPSSCWCCLSLSLSSFFLFLFLVSNGFLIKFLFLRIQWWILLIPGSYRNLHTFHRNPK